jgi:Uma2 family endonuclease
MKSDRPATVEDLLRTPEDGRKYELVDGTIVVSPGGMMHSEVGMRIGSLLLAALGSPPEGHVYGSDVGLVLPNGNVRSPDVTFVGSEKLPDGKSPVTFGEVIPDLVVEVLSPSDRADHVDAKIAEFLGCGVGVVWLVDPSSRTVTVYRSISDRRRLRSEESITLGSILPAFAARVADFF